ncbi:ABC transporter ATP-binding protein [Cohnella nanjingensis]|uniref:ATP-binding cassette domain-containing protein n=1 Tax=Cohnella nanjingensis TaxID=1387779 RepID=A0A7X0RQC3_9BACL|nr:ATP-binding cassette domain-containing protein [Cohnella nanjingensis]MBB6670546.1 ATP-binding cassette domain-containing protein [Cohnella nanjingensis]
MLEAIGLEKTFVTSVPRAGRFKAVRTLFSREKRAVTAVKALDFRVAPGEFVGFIGPNGAGKSTTIKMLCGILHPSAGEVRVAGHSPQRDRRKVVRKIGVVFGQRTQLWWDLPLKDSFDILAAMFRLSPAEKERQLVRLEEVLRLREFWDTPVRKLSLGQRMRGDLAAALLHDPEMLVLDEPTIGMDVTAKRQIRTHLKLLNEAYGKTILLTTHDMDDIEQLCQRVIVISRGERIYDGEIGQLRERIGLPTVIRVAYRGDYRIPAGAEAGGGADVPDGGFRIVERREREVAVGCNRSETGVMDVLRQLSQWGEVDDVRVEEPDFEDIIHRIY